MRTGRSYTISKISGAVFIRRSNNMPTSLEKTKNVSIYSMSMQGLFFRNVADHFFDAIVMNISRLTDPPTTKLGKKKFRNVTITRIPEMKSTPPELKAELESDIKRALDLIADIKYAYRNKRLGHNDLDVMTSERGFIPDSAITLLREMIDSLHAPYRKLRAAVEGVDCRPGVIDDRPEFGLMGALFVARHCKKDFVRSSIKESLDEGGPPQCYPDWLIKNDEEAKWM